MEAAAPLGQGWEHKHLDRGVAGRGEGNGLHFGPDKLCTSSGS